MSADSSLLPLFQKIASEKREEEEVILLKRFCITVLLSKYFPPSPGLFLSGSDCGSSALCCHCCCRCARSELGAHLLSRATRQMERDTRLCTPDGRGVHFIQLRRWHILMCAETHQVQKLRCLRQVMEYTEFFRSLFWMCLNYSLSVW